MSIYKEPPPGMFVVPDPQDMTKVKTEASQDLIHICRSLEAERLVFIEALIFSSQAF